MAIYVLLLVIVASPNANGMLYFEGGITGPGSREEDMAI